MSEPLLPLADRKVYSVTELNTLVHDCLESSLPEVWVEGEISNCKLYPSGHTYLSLKDERSQVRAVLWKGNSWAVKFKPADGLKVLARGRLTSYVARGELQLVISAMEPREKGALQQAFEQLKAKLQAEGLFDEGRKRPLPRYPSSVGLVTSLQGAAIRDMLSVLKRRWPGVEILILPVAVQGAAAKDGIAQGIADFNRLAPETDVLLVGRGGGSIEDLWAFNEEVVARAIAASEIPVISCVGHETDFTIADFVADARAPTPSAAAELAVPDVRSVLEGVLASEEEMAGLMREKLARLLQRLEHARKHPFLQSPWRIYEQKMQRVDELSARLPQAMRQILLHAQKDLQLCAEKLDAFSPLKVLGRGYAIALKRDGKVVRRAKDVKKGENLTVRLGEGSIDCEVTGG